MTRRKKQEGSTGMLKPRARDTSVLFEREEVQQRIKQISRRGRLDALTRFVHEPRWREALARELPEESVDEIMTKLESDHQRLVNEFRHEAERSTRQTDPGSEGPFEGRTDA